MRTSSQLRKTDACEHNPHANISVNNAALKEAAIQKGILNRALKGEPITNYKLELMNSYDETNRIWETEEQRNLILSLQALRLERFVEWENNNPNRSRKYFKENINGGEPIVVNYFGEEIAAKPDYLVETDRNLYVCKVKTGRYTDNMSDNLNSPEGYCLGLAGEKFAQDNNLNKRVVVQYLYLGDANVKQESASLQKGPRGTFVLPYDIEGQYNKISESYFDDKMKRDAENIYEAAKEGASCSPEDCASCSMNNVCHYEEAPISAPAQEAVRPVTDIRLSNDQRNVILYDRGIARVNAGPGSGKTLVTALRVAELVKNGANPDNICLLTFTNAGAGEMTARAVAYSAAAGVPVDPDRFTSTTFNAFCQDIISNKSLTEGINLYEELGYSRKPRIIPDETKRAIINKILDQFPKNSKWSYSQSSAKRPSYSKYREPELAAYTAASRHFSEIKKEQYTRDNYPSSWDNIYSQTEIDFIFLMNDEFNRQLIKKSLMEFDDQILKVKELLDMHPDLFERLGYEHIIVDEFQDTDLPEIELLQKMVDTTAFKSLMCVGDDSQSIFAFRHTSPEYMVNFGHYFGRFDDFSLVENHRSNKNTIDMANKICDEAKVKVDKTLIATKPEGNTVKVEGFYTKKQEYEYIANQIKEKWDAGNHDIAVIMSDRFQLTEIADMLTKLGIPSTLKSPVLVTQNSRVCALTTFYDAFMGRSTQGFIDYRNIIEHGNLKGKSGAELEAIAEQFRGDVRACERTLSTFVEFAKALDINNTDECYQDFLEKVESCRDMEELSEFMEDFKLYGGDSTFKREGRYDGVCLTTIHSSKGLEWDTTFLCLDKLDSIKYHTNRTALDTEYDEQIRKWFVGATRAREELIMTGEAFLKVDNKTHHATENSFLKRAYELQDKLFYFTLLGYNQEKEQEKLRELMENGAGPEQGLSSNVARAILNNATLLEGARRIRETNTREEVEEDRER